MFSSFEKSFKSKNQEYKVPKEVLDLLSEQLPKNFQYSYIDGGAVAVFPKNGNIVIGAQLTMPEDFIPSNPRDLMEYIYRTQQELKLLPSEEGFITINGSKFKLNEIVQFPFGDKELGEGDFIIRPAPFQPPFKIRLQGLGVEKEFTIQRQPYGDLKKSLFRDIENGPLEISYIIEEDKFALKLDCKIQIEKAGSIKEIVDSLILYSACFKGDLKIMGGNLPKVEEPHEERGIAETIAFWEKILMVESKLGVAFVPTFPVTRDDAIWVERLYRSFIEQKPYKENIKFNKISMVTTEDFVPENILGSDHLALNYIQESEIEFMQVTIKTVDAAGIFGFIVKDVLIKNKEKMEYDIFFDPKNENGIYRSIRHFISEDEAEGVLKNIEELQNAELINL